MNSPKGLWNTTNIRNSGLATDNIDLLVIDNLGATANKTRNVISSMKAYSEDTNIRRIYIRDLSDGAKGNGSGVGYADYVSAKVVQKIDRLKTYEYCIASSDPRIGATPIYYETDREILRACSKSIGDIHFKDIKIVYIKDETSFDEMVVSRALIRDMKDHQCSSASEMCRTIEFDEMGNIISPFQDKQKRNSILTRIQSFFSTNFWYGL